MINCGRERKRIVGIRQAFGLVVIALTPLCLHAGTTTYTYDVHGRISGVVTAPAGANPSTSVITYDNGDNRIAIGTETPPNPPTGLQATAVAYNEIQVTWNSALDANGAAIAHYNLYRGGIFLASSTATSYSDTTVAANTSYSYTLTAVDAYGYESPQSSSASATTPPGPDLIPPSVPVNLEGVAVSGTQINLSWSASTDTGGSGLAGYKIFRDGTQIGTSTVATYSDTGLSVYTSYSYSVLAYDGAGNQSAQSNAVSVTTLDSIPPSAPGTPTFSAITWNSATASWAAATDNVGVTNYRYSLNGGASWTAVGNSTTASLSGLTIGTQYTMYVEAGDAAGNWGPASSGSFATSSYYTENFSLTVGTYETYNYSNYPYVTPETVDVGYLVNGWGSLTPTTTNTGRTIWEVDSHTDYTVGQTWIVLEVTGFSSNPGAGWLQSITVPNVGVLTGASASFSCSGGSTCYWEWPNPPSYPGDGTVTLVHQ